MSLNLNNLNLFNKGDNPFLQKGMSNPFNQDLKFQGVSGGGTSKTASVSRNPFSDLQEIAKLGSAFSADGGVGRKIEGGMHTSAGMAGQRLQLFA